MFRSCLHAHFVYISVKKRETQKSKDAAHTTDNNQYNFPSYTDVDDGNNKIVAFNSCPCFVYSLSRPYYVNNELYCMSCIMYMYTVHSQSCIKEQR